MPQDGTPNGDAPTGTALGPYRRVVEMQTKLHRWAVTEPGRRFDDLFNLVHDPATLVMAYGRVAGNLGARTAGVDGLTVADVEQHIGVPGFLDDLRARLKAARSGHCRCGNVRSRSRVDRVGSASSGFRRLRTGSCRRR